MWSIIITIGAVAIASLTSGPASDVSRLVLSPPVVVGELDMGKLKGNVSRLSWSPDGRQFYVQTVERDGIYVKLRHYLVALDGSLPVVTDSEPVWSLGYWPWKSGQAAPGMPAFKIEIDQQDKRVTSTSTPMGGDMARGAPSGSGGISTGEAADAAWVSQTARTVTLRLKGEVVGEFINTAAAPGATFGWAPAGVGLIAFAAPKDGRLVIMDEKGAKLDVPGSKAAAFPGWSNDGKRLAYLEKTARKKYQLKIVDIGRTPE